MIQCLSKAPKLTPLSSSLVLITTSNRQYSILQSNHHYPKNTFSNSFNSNNNGNYCCSSFSTRRQFNKSPNGDRSLSAVAATLPDLSPTTHHVPRSEKFMLILGKPGGGKGTISKKIIADFPNIQHFSTGDLLRQHVRNQDDDIGREAKAYMDAGDLVPDDLIIRLVMDDAMDVIHNGKNILLDGFPRTLEQAWHLDEYVHVDVVVDLNIPNDTIVERIADRWIHPASGRVYNYSYNPPLTYGKDDETGDDLVQREDDKPEIVRRRLEAHDKVTAPMIEYYDQKGVLKKFHGTMSDVIYPQVKQWLNEEGC